MFASTNAHSILEKYNGSFRQLINAKLWRRGKETEPILQYIRRALKFNKESDWNFLCTAMDIIGDANEAIRHFSEFQLEGATKYNDDGEKYLRLYGVLNAAYLQQEAIANLYRICQLGDLREARQTIFALAIRVLRNKLGAHSNDYKKPDNSAELECFVPIRCSLRGFNCEYKNTGDLTFHRVDLKAILEEHLKLMADLYDRIFEKLAKTIYATSETKFQEVMSWIEVPRLERQGNIVVEANGLPRIIIRASG